MGTPFPFIATKILVPRRRSELLRRQRLLDFIHRHIDRKLIIISAPAGYGKTSLLVDFAGETNLPICWYTLDPFDSDLRIFLQYLVASIRQRFPRFGQEVLQALESAEGEPDLLAFTGLLVNAIYNEIPEYFVIVLDDYHNVDDSNSVNAFLDTFLNYLPENCHIILASRTLPVKLTLTALTAKQEVAGIGPLNLRFTPDEIKLLIERNYQIVLTDAQAEKLTAIYEGWITGIILSVTRLRDEAVEAIIEQGISKGQVFDYLAEEVFACQPPELQRFLLDSSVLAEMSASLCDELLDRDDSHQKLRLLDTKILFVEKLEEGGEEWYRYHNLFREFLQKKLAQEAPERFHTLHLKAGNLWRKRHLPEKAVEHYLEAKAFDEALSLVELLAESLYFQGRWHLLISWIDALPPGQLSRSGDLLLYRGRICLETGEVEKAQGLFERSMVAYASQGNRAGMSAALLERATALRLQGRLEEAVEVAKQALEFTPPPATAVKALGYKTLGICYGILGGLEEGIKNLTEALVLYEASGSAYDVALLHHDLGSMYTLSGQLDEALKHYREALGYWRSTNNVVAMTNTLNSLGVVYYYAGEYTQALKWLEEAWAKARQINNPRMEATILAGMGDVYQDLREYDKALDYYKSALETAKQAREGFIIFYATNSIGELLRRRGKPGEARKWLDEAYALAKEHRSEYETGLNLLHKGLLSQDEGNPTEAQILLNEALELFIQAGARRETAKALFYLAYLYFRQSDFKKSLLCLDKMVRQLQEPGCEGFLLADKERLIPLINLALREHLAVEFFQRLKEKLQATISTLVKISATSTEEILPYLEIYALGPGRVARDGHMLRSSDWNTATTRELFFFFLYHPEGLRKEQILAEMWPEMPVSKANGLFHSSLYRLRQAIHPECIIYENGIYRFNERFPRWQDVDAFEELLSQARRKKTSEKKDLLTRAIGMYRGDFLEDCYRDWCSEYRERLLEKYIRALLELARIYFQEGDYEQAIEMGRLAIAKDPFREEAYRLLIRCSTLQGDRTSALKWFQRCQKVLEKEIGVQPGPDTIQAYREALQS